jgi:hypothetical protein
MFVEFVGRDAAFKIFKRLVKSDSGKKLEWQTDGLAVEFDFSPGKVPDQARLDAFVSSLAPVQHPSNASSSSCSH